MLTFFDSFDSLAIELEHFWVPYWKQKVVTVVFHHSKKCPSFIFDRVWETGKIRYHHLVYLVSSLVLYCFFITNFLHVGLPLALFLFRSQDVMVPKCGSICVSTPAESTDESSMTGLVVDKTILQLMQSLSNNSFSQKRSVKEGYLFLFLLR